MNLEVQRKLNQLLEEALDLPANERVDFAKSACANHLDLLQKLLDLLDLQDEAKAWLATHPATAQEVTDTYLNEMLGPYRLTQRLGQGGMGTVYLGERQDGEVDMQVAIKLLHGHHQGSQERFLRERQLLADLKHAHIATLLDAGTTPSGDAFLVMELVQGQQLLHWYNASCPSLAELLTLMLKLTNALAVAHEKGIVHRDVKPDNVMVTAQGEPKLLDFGIALIAGIEERGPSLLTPGYAAPEQREKKPLSPACDVFALGLVLLQLLADRPIGALNRAPLEAVNALFASDQDLPKALAHVLRNALETEPAARYCDAAAFGAALQRLLTQLQTQGSTELKESRYDLTLWFDACDSAVAQSVIENLVAHTRLKLYPSPGSTEQAIAQSGACLVLHGPNAHWSQDPETLDALAFHCNSCQLIGIRLPDASETDLPQFLAECTWLDMNTEDLIGLTRTVESLCHRQRKVAPTETFCPFRGLEVFREEDRELFFGREHVSYQILDHLKEKGSMAVLGPSGSGKSSLINAGVLPQLRESGYNVILLKPGSQPLLEIAHAFCKLLPKQRFEAHSLADHMSRVEDLPRLLQQAFAAAAVPKTCLVVDQAEELFTLTGQGDVRRQAIEALCFVAEWLRGSGAFLVTMRVDFLGECATFPDWNALITESFLQLTPMDHEQLARAIELPARLAGLVLEHGLLERILDDVTETPGVLPLMEHALFELYQRRHGTLLTLAAFEALGGIEGALTKRAENEYLALNQLEKAALRKVFTRCLIQPGEEGRDTRRRALREDVLAQAEASARLDGIMERWTQCRLLSATSDAISGAQTLELAHEALIYKWQRVAQWMAEDRQTAYLLSRLRQQARHWEEADCHRDFLPHGAQLQQFNDLELTHRLGRLEQDYLRAGRRRQRRQKWLKNGLLAAAILIPVVFAITQSVHNKRLAQERDVSAKVTEFFISLFRSAKDSIGDEQTITAEDILDQGRKNIVHQLQEPYHKEARIEVLEGLSTMYASLDIWGRSLPLAVEYMELVEVSPDSVEQLVRSKILTAEMYWYQQKVEAGLQCIEDILPILENKDIPKDLVTKTYRTAGLLNMDKGDISKSLDFFEKEVELLKQESGTEKELAQANKSIARAYLRNGFQKKGLFYIEESLKYLLMEEKPDYKELSNRNEVLAFLYFAIGQEDLAKDYALRSINYKDKIIKTSLASKCFEFHELGFMINSFLMLEKSTEFQDYLMQLAESFLNPESPLLGYYFSRYAFTKRMIEDFDSSIEYYERALLLNRKIHGESVFVARDYHYLSVIYERLEKFDLMLKYSQEAYRIHSDLLGEHHSKTIKDIIGLAYAYNKRGDYYNALKYSIKEYQLSVENFGEDHFETLISSGGVANLLLTIDELEIANHFLESAYEYSYHDLDNNNFPHYYILSLLGNTLSRLNQPEIGLLMFQDAYEYFYSQSMFLNESFRLSGQSSYGEILYNLGEKKLGHCLAEEAYQNLLSKFGPKNSSTVAALMRLRRLQSTESDIESIAKSY